MNKRLGFTLVEIIVTLSVITILSTFVFAGMQESGRQSRDAKRQADMRIIQGALELYKNKHGRYPEGCNTNDNTYDGANVWSGQPDSDYACPGDSSDYIRGNTGRFFSEYIPRLPIDPRPTAVTNDGYVYRTNSAGTVYKLIALRSVETSEVTGYVTGQSNISFRLCDSLLPNNDGAQGLYDPNAPLSRCALVTTAAGDVEPPHCVDSNPTFRTSYASFGGIDNNPNFQIAARNTENIICSAPM